MNWLKILITILEYIIPALAKKGKDNLADELTIAKQTITVLSKDKTPEEKGLAVEEAIGNLKAVQNFKKRAMKKLDKAKARLYKKLF